jgi:hypothetical protein
MNTTVKPETVKNYSDKQEARIRELAPLNLEKAKILAAEFDKSYQSIISKCKQLEVAYEKKAAPRKKAVQATKEELVDQIEAITGFSLEGLEKGTRKSVLNMLTGVRHMQHTINELTPEYVLPEIGDSAK